MHFKLLLSFSGFSEGIHPKEGKATRQSERARRKMLAFGVPPGQRSRLRQTRRTDRGVEKLRSEHWAEDLANGKSASVCEGKNGTSAFTRRSLALSAFADFLLLRFFFFFSVPARRPSADGFSPVPQGLPREKLENFPRHRRRQKFPFSGERCPTAAVPPRGESLSLLLPFRERNKMCSRKRRRVFR